MARAYNNSLVLVRFLALLFICLGAFGMAFVTVTVLFFATGAARWLIEPALSYAAQSVFSSPVYLVGGVMIMRRSVRIARFIASYCEAE